jgi:hypothetical protein
MQALRSTGLLILWAAVCWPAAASNSAVGHTYISYDPSSKLVTATCRTDLDMYAQAWYRAVVVCTISNPAGTVLALKRVTDTTGDLGYATATVTITGTPGVTYKAVGNHSVLVTEETDTVSPPSRLFNDYYYYQYFTADGESQIYSPDVNTWYGPGPQRLITAHSLPLGYTFATLVFPDHIRVNSDDTQVYSCPHGNSRNRWVNYEVIATDNSTWTKPMSLVETVDPSTRSSCNGETVATSYSCTPIAAGGTFTDYLNPGCPGSDTLAQGCGFTFPDQKWEWCPPIGSPVSLGDVGTAQVNNTSISLGGNTVGFPIGKTFPK